MLQRVHGHVLSVQRSRARGKDAHAVLQDQPGAFDRRRVCPNIVFAVERHAAGNDRVLFHDVQRDSQVVAVHTKGGLVDDGQEEQPENV